MPDTPDRSLTGRTPGQPQSQQVKPADDYASLDKAVLDTIEEMTWWMFDKTCIGMGAFRQFDYTMRGDLGPDLSPRLGECYMLAMQAFTGWEKFQHQAATAAVLGATHDLPAPRHLVHGFWKHPDEPEGINHAWVELEGGYIWEPITGLICNPILFHEFGQTRDDAAYTEHDARVLMLRNQHYGPWH